MSLRDELAQMTTASLGGHRAGQLVDDIVEECRDRASRGNGDHTVYLRDEAGPVVQQAKDALEGRGLTVTTGSTCGAQVEGYWMRVRW